MLQPGHGISLLCLLFFHSLYVTAWKEHGLKMGNSEGYQNECFVCTSIISEKYTDMYDYDWNLNEFVTKSPVNKIFKKVVVMNLVVSFPVRGTNSLNFREN